jgi:hypothetical protein
MLDVNSEKLVGNAGARGWRSRRRDRLRRLAHCRCLRK